MTKDEALKLALEAMILNNAEWKRLADSGDGGYWSAEEQDHYKQTEQAITAIKEALAQPEKDGVALTNIPHPNGTPAPDDLNADALEVVELELPDEDEAVGWADGGVINWIAGKQFKHASYLYATPPQRTWVGLTDEQARVKFEAWHKSTYTQPLERYGHTYKNMHVRNRWQGWLAAQGIERGV